MSLTTARTALHSVLAGVAGIKRVVRGMPATVQTTPLIYTEFASFTRAQKGQLTTMTYRFRVVLCVPFHENTNAEAEIEPFVNKIPIAIDADATLGGEVNFADVPEGFATGADGYLNIGDVTYRTVVFMVDVLKKGTYQGGTL